ncbi:hypothetical protein GCM10022395_30670 [Snuella lapsa]|uniref:DUF306 domain-containing protein n=2 Tax=Snuella lapsa TaxID=870481 RepID=A0ABP6YBP5_9FLAO
MLSCNDKNVQENQDYLIDNDWLLITITTDNETIVLEEKDYYLNSAFVLDFIDDTSFYLNTSINMALGKYVLKNDTIKFTEYHESTEVGTTDPKQTKINKHLLENMERVTNFSVSGNQLVLFGPDMTYVFVKN